MMRIFHKVVFTFFSVVPLFAKGQNIGIGTIDGPTRAKLEVPGVAGGGNTGAIFGTDGAGISLQRNGPAIGFNQYRDDILPGAAGKYLSNGFASVIYLKTDVGQLVFEMYPSGTANNSTPAPTGTLTISNVGHVGIQTGSLDATLSVGRGTGIDGTAVFVGDAYASHFNYAGSDQTYIRSGTTSSKLFINRESQGDVLIGAGLTRVVINRPNTVPGATVDILQATSTTDNLTQQHNTFNHRWGQRVNFTNAPTYGAGNLLFFLYNNLSRGRFAFWNGGYSTSSDATLKTDIEPLGPVLENLLKLRPVEYEVIDNGSQSTEKYTGLIAQEVKPYFPWLVRVVDNDQQKNRIRDLHTMNYTGLSVVAIKALQEQDKMIDALEAEYQELLTRLEKLEKTN